MSKELADITVEQTEKQLTRLEKKVGEKFHLASDPVYITPELMQASDDAIRRAGIIQGLQDLGYLPEMEDSHTSKEFTDTEIAGAAELWRADTRSLGALYRPAFADDLYTGNARGYSSQKLDLTDPLPVLLKQTSFEGELQLFKIPVPGESPSLLSRILQFRLKTFNFYDDRVDKSFSHASHEAFLELKTLFGYSEKESDVIFLNHLGNVSKLSSRFCNRYRDHVFVYKDPVQADDGHEAGAYCIKWEKKTIRVKVPNSKINRRKKISEYPVLQYNSHEQNPRNLDSINMDAENILGLELLQLRLWQHGYYTGAIDADWGDMSKSALIDFFGSCEVFEKDETQIRDKAKGGYVLNLVYILSSLLPLAEKTVKQIKHEHLNRISEELFPEKKKDRDWNDLSTRAEENLAEEGNVFKAKKIEIAKRNKDSASSKKTYKRRRLNFSWTGIKGAIGGWFRRFKEEVKDILKAISKIAKKIREFIIKGVRSVSTIFRFILLKIKRAVRIATAAVRRLHYWLTGTPFGSHTPDSSGFIVTRWSLDFDTINYCSKGCPPSVIKQHMNYINFMNASFHFMLSVAFAVIEILVHVVSNNWLLVAHSIYKGVVKLKDWNTEQDPYLSYLVT